jgi:hypothetical protein
MRHEDFLDSLDAVTRMQYTTKNVGSTYMSYFIFVFFKSKQFVWKMNSNGAAVLKKNLMCHFQLPQSSDQFIRSPNIGS